jgi:lipopolysaccharide/colanic/teichoic acid biosynthesis glycosyltransferase
MYRIFKRLIDLLVSVIALILLAPLMVAVAILVWLTMGPPILFRQARAGYRGSPFTLFKFTTMRSARDAQRRLLPDKDRLTRVGVILRRFSLDELPQLWNVLIGDMSLVGPRPLLADYLPRYSPEQARRHEVKPGITGWAQVNGRNTLSWEQKFNLDVWYVDHWNLWLDLRIVFGTFWKALKRDGINQPGQATAEEFLGGRASAAKQDLLDQKGVCADGS